MISHDCITYTARYLPTELLKLPRHSERMVSFLPLSHIAAQEVDIFVAIHLGGTVYFAQPDALKGTLAKTLKEARPTAFFAVPRVWEKMQDNIEKTVKALTGLKADLLKVSRKVATQHVKEGFENPKQGCDVPFCLAKNLVLIKVLKETGLDQCRNFYSGAAPINRDTLEFFFSLGIPYLYLYILIKTHEFSIKKYSFNF